MKNKTIIFASLFVSFLSITAIAQDIVIKTNGDKIKAKVLEVTQTEIKYKRFESLSGPTYTVSISEIESIKYKDGTKELSINKLYIC